MAQLLHQPLLLENTHCRGKDHYMAGPILTGYDSIIVSVHADNKTISRWVKSNPVKL